MTVRDLKHVDFLLNLINSEVWRMYDSNGHTKTEEDLLGDLYTAIEEARLIISKLEEDE